MAVQARAAAEFLAAKYPNGIALVLGVRALVEEIQWDEERTDQAESAWQRLDEHLGFASSRPDQAYGAGPDNLWVLAAERHAVLELKTGSTAAHIAKHELDRLGGSVRRDQREYPGVTSVPVLVRPSRVYDEHGTAVPGMRVVTPTKLDELKLGVIAYAVALADGQGRWGDEQAVAAQLAHGRLDAGSLFQTYAEAPAAASRTKTVRASTRADHPPPVTGRLGRDRHPGKPRRRRTLARPVQRRIRVSSSTTEADVTPTVGWQLAGPGARPSAEAAPRSHQPARADSSTVAAALDLLEPQLFPEQDAWARRHDATDLIAQVGALWDAAADAHTGPGLCVREIQARSWAVGQLRAAADLGRAIELGQRVVADSERVIGPDHPDALASRNNLAYAYESAGRLGEAIPLFEHTLADSERVLGPDHPDTLASRNNLAYAYRPAGRLGEAIPLFEQTLAERERVLGPDHPDTLTSRNNLAYAYRPAGRLGEAIPLHEQALADRERVLGPDHPQALASRNNLAYAYESAGRLGEAIPLFEQALADCERVLGSDHPQALASRNNLAGAYRSAGRSARRSRCLSRPWPTASGCSAPTTRTRLSRGITWLAPMSRRAGSARRSRCLSRPWPTVSGCSAPTTPARSPHGTT